MKIAAVIFAIAAIAYLAWGGVLLSTGGLKINLLFMAIFGGALLAQSYSLFRSMPKARIYGLISSGTLFCCTAIVATIILLPAQPLGVSEWPQEFRLTVGLAVTMTAAFGLAFFSLLGGKRAP